MKILVISTNYLPQVGGVEIVVHETISRLAKKHKVVLVTQGWAPAKKQENFTIFRTYLGFLGKSLRSSLAFPFLFPLSLCRLIYLCQQQRFDLIHLHFLDWSGIYAILLKRIFKIPAITSLHGSDVYSFPHKKWHLRKLFNIVISQTDYVTGCSQYLIDQARQLSSASFPPAQPLYNGVDLNLFSNQTIYQSEKKPYILFVGRLHHVKGVDLLIRAFAKLQPQKDNLQLKIVGHGQEMNNLRQLAFKLKIDHLVNFLGPVEHDKLPPFYANALFTVIPSRKEAFGIVALESLACGTPVIATDVGGLPDVITPEYGLLSPKNDRSALTENMKKLLEDGKLRSKLARGAIEQIKKFSWEKTVEKLEEIYQLTIRNFQQSAKT